MFGIYDCSLFESSGGNEIAYRYPSLLGCLYNFCGFWFRVIGEQCFSDGRMQSSASDGRTFAHPMDVSKKTAKRKMRSYPVSHCRPGSCTVSEAPGIRPQGPLRNKGNKCFVFSPREEADTDASDVDSSAEAQPGRTPSGTDGNPLQEPH